MAIADAENVYRRVQSRPEIPHETHNGRIVHLSTTAFNDRGHKPSVDRAALRGSAAELKVEPTDGVLQLLVADIRAIDSVEQQAGQPYRIDVVARPIPYDNPDGLPENLAHAQIESDPELANATRFKRLKEALARLAEGTAWVIVPGGS